MHRPSYRPRWFCVLLGTRCRALIMTGLIACAVGCTPPGMSYYYMGAGTVDTSKAFYLLHDTELPGSGGTMRYDEALADVLRNEGIRLVRDIKKADYVLAYNYDTPGPTWGAGLPLLAIEAGVRAQQLKVKTFDAVIYDPKRPEDQLYIVKQLCCKNMPEMAVELAYNIIHSPTGRSSRRNR